MTVIVSGAINFDQDELDWFLELHAQTPWAVYTAGIDEIITHDRQQPGEDPDGEPFTGDSARAYLAELDARFGPGSPMDLGHPLYAVALHFGVPAFGSHEHSHAPGARCACGASASTEECPGVLG